MKKQFLALTGALAAVASLSYAIPFDSSSGGPEKATVGPDPGNDYSTLAAAATAFSSVSGGINREWTLEITGNLTETAASYFGNVFGPGGKLIIKPKVGTQPTVSFTIGSAPPGIYGCIVFGVTDGQLPTAANDRPSNGNFVIDGSNTVGGTTRDLTFQIPATHNDPMVRVVRIWGDTKNMVIKNLRVINYDNSGSGHCIGLASGSTSDATPVPRKVDGLVIDNCYLESKPGGTSGFGVDTSITANGSLPSGQCPSDITVRNCTIVAKQRGIFLHMASGNMENNTITLANGTGTALSYAGCFAFGNNSTSGGTVVIRNNIIEGLVPSTASGQGLFAILYDSGMNGTNVEVYNNILKNFTFSATTPADLIYRGISIGTAGSTVKVEHNSLDLPANNTAVSAATAGNVAGIAIAVTMTSPATVKNNIVRMGNTGTTAMCIRLAAATNVTCEGNNLVRNGSPLTGRVGSTDYPTLADWQGAGFDSAASGGQSVDPASVVPAWDANLHFALKPVGLGKVASSTVLTDIDGDARPATGAYPGADEPPGPAAGVADWALF
ncbi:MAG: hypothetical protein N2Z21_05575 [Candidatus Sumerlaeaceae bacterium]|nr:hypothetical protein [Candidatus Sumerlaeaceae bacterium]